MNIPNLEVNCYPLGADGDIPNNSSCPLLVYPQVLSADAGDRASQFEDLFARNQWGDSWRNGIFSYHHYHSTAHEVLGIYQGWARVLLGGPNGVELRVEAGDVVVVPAGVGHMKTADGQGFACVGAYPINQTPDLCRPEGSVGDATRRVQAVPLPNHDPVHGAAGPLFHHWQPSQGQL